MKEMSLFMYLAEKVIGSVNIGLSRTISIFRKPIIYGMSPRDKKQIRKIIFEHFNYIADQWKEFQKKR